MGKLIRLLRLNLSPETGAFLGSLDWPPEEMITGMSFHLSDGREIRLGADLAKEMKLCLDAAAANASGGRAVAPVEVQPRWNITDVNAPFASSDWEHLQGLAPEKFGGRQ